MNKFGQFAPQLLKDEIGAAAAESGFIPAIISSGIATAAWTRCGEMGELSMTLLSALTPVLDANRKSWKWFLRLVEALGRACQEGQFARMQECCGRSKYWSVSGSV